MLRGTNNKVKKKGKVFKYTIQEKVRIVMDYDSTPDYRGKLADVTRGLGVDKNFISKARKTVNSLKDLYQLNLPESLPQTPQRKMNCLKMSLSPGRPIFFPDEERWLYMKFLQLEAHARCANQHNSVRIYGCGPFSSSWSSKYETVARMALSLAERSMYSPFTGAVHCDCSLLARPR